MINLNEVFNYTIDMFWYMIGALPIISIFRIFSIVNMKKNNIKTSLLHEIGIIIFISFLIGLASQTILPDPNIQVDDGDINLSPFLVFKQTYHTVFVDGYWSYFLVNFLGNIFIFMPIGFFIPLLWNNKHYILISIFSGFSISFLIEILQLFLPRRTDIDDLILNTFGTILGVICFYILNKRFPNFINRFKTTYNE